MPWFENDIFVTTYTRLITYALSDIFLPIFLLILLVLFGLSYLLKNDFNTKYDFLFPLETEKETKPSKTSVLFFLFTFLIYAIVVYWLNGGAFSNYDIMNDSFRTGTWQQYGYMRRLNPLVFIDMTFLYGLTHNYVMINSYVIFIHALCMFFLFRLLSNIPASRKFYILGTVTLLPAYFWTNNIVFAERLILIYMFISFICLKNWVKTKHISWILGYLFWMNMACYTKETNVLFYAAFVAVLLLKHLYDEKITLSSFLHPIKSIKQFPLEFLTGLSILFFTVQHAFIVQGIKENTYYLKRYGSWLEVADLYAVEIGIMLISLIYILFKKPKKPFWHIMYFSALISALFIIGYLRLIATGYTSGRTYYITVPMVFILISWLCSIRKKFVFFYTVTWILAFSAVMDYKVFQYDNGRDTLEMAQFVKAKNGKVSLVLGYSFENVFWSCSSWARSFKSYMPQRDLVIKAAQCPEELYETARNYSLVNQFDLEPNDYYIIRKDKYAKKEKFYQKDIDFLSSGYKSKKVFENKFYDVYQILDERDRNKN